MGKGTLGGSQKTPGAGGASETRSQGGSKGVGGVRSGRVRLEEEWGHKTTERETLRVLTVVTRSQSQPV